MTSKSVFALLGLLPVLAAQVPTISIDGSRPYIDVVFERLEPAVPGPAMARSQGLRLKLRNNCILPLEVDLAGNSPGSDLLLRHEVIEVARRYPAVGDKPYAVTKPSGYAGIDVVNSLELKPGGEVSFSVPLTHVTRAWFIRIAVTLVHPVIAKGVQPRTYVEFDWSALPPEVRQASDRVLYGKVE